MFHRAILLVKHGPQDADFFTAQEAKHYLLVYSASPILPGSNRSETVLREENLGVCRPFPRPSKVYNLDRLFSENPRV